MQPNLNLQRNLNAQPKPLADIERALMEHQRAAAYKGPPDAEAVLAIIGECDWWSEMQILNDQDREEERLP